MTYARMVVVIDTGIETVTDTGVGVMIAIVTETVRSIVILV